MRVITEEMIGNFKNYLYEEEKSKATGVLVCSNLINFKITISK